MRITVGILIYIIQEKKDNVGLTPDVKAGRTTKESDRRMSNYRSI